MQASDAVVVGAGVLWRLAEGGVRATGCEQVAPGHDRASSHSASRTIRTAYRFERWRTPGRDKGGRRDG